MAARGMGAIVPATGATGMAPIAAVGGKTNSPIGKVCLGLCCLACSCGMGNHVSSCIEAGFSTLQECLKACCTRAPQCPEGIQMQADVMVDV